MTSVCRYLAVVALLAPIAARAEAPDDQVTFESREAEAAAILEEGQALFDVHLYDAAIERFELSYSIAPKAETALALTHAYRAKDDDANALRAYTLYRSLKPRSGPAVVAAATPRSSAPELIQATHVAPSPPPPPLSRALVERPLLLPPGLFEATAALGFGYQSIVNTSWVTGLVGGRARWGLPIGEISIGVDLAPVHSQPTRGTVDVPVFQRTNVSAIARLTDDTGLGLRAGIGLVDSELRSYGLGLAADHKVRPSTRVAIVVGGALSYTEFGAGTVRRFAADGTGELQLQVGPSLAVSALASVTQVLVEVEAGNDSSRQLYGYGVSATIAVSDHVTTVPYVSVYPTGDLTTYIVGFSVSHY